MLDITTEDLEAIEAEIARVTAAAEELMWLTEITEPGTPAGFALDGKISAARAERLALVNRARELQGLPPVLTRRARRALR